MVEARRELVELLRKARGLLASPGNDFAWSSWKDGPVALAELDHRLARIKAGELPSRVDLTILFAPAGPMQEVSVNSGWAEEFLAVASKFDAIAERVWAEPNAATDPARAS
jgi:hypothetical protein